MQSVEELFRAIVNGVADVAKEKVQEDMEANSATLSFDDNIEFERAVKSVVQGMDLDFVFGDSSFASEVERVIGDHINSYDLVNEVTESREFRDNMEDLLKKIQDDNLMKSKADVEKIVREQMVHVMDQRITAFLNSHAFTLKVQELINARFAALLNDPPLTIKIRSIIAQEFDQMLIRIQSGINDIAMSVRE